MTRHTLLLSLAAGTLLFGGCWLRSSSSTSTTAPQATVSFPPSNAMEVSVEEKFKLAPSFLSDELLAEGWISLFDGQTLFGWEPFGAADWRVEDGAIVVEKGEKGLLCTTASWGDYELHAEFLAEEKTNSGIFLHTPTNPADPAADCYELNIAPPENPFPTGSLVQREKAPDVKAEEGWHSYDVTLQGGEVVIRLDGKETLKYTDPKPLARGRIGLQHNEGQVAFRNIRLKPLGMKKIFSGKDLEGWREYPDMASRFTITEEGELNVKDGRGQLETKNEFGDFVLQLECQTHAAELNSGIFFRCIPGDVMMGYECQIHNGYKNDDRTQPVDCGTGGFFRRQNARYVAADDKEWFHLTLVAEGSHMAAWVNGYAVSDWTDTRKSDENPRQGLRTKAGTLMIQGHDPTTDISFRNLRVAELAPRADVEQ